MKHDKREIDLILKVKKKIICDPYMSLLELKKIANSIFRAVIGDFFYTIKGNDVTSMDQMNILRGLDYYKSNLIEVSPSSDRKVVDSKREYSSVPISIRSDMQSQSEPSNRNAKNNNQSHQMSYRDQEIFRRNLEDACDSLDEIKNDVVNISSREYNAKNVIQANHLVQKTEDIINDTNQFLKKYSDIFESNSGSKSTPQAQGSRSQTMGALQEENECLKATIDQLNLQLSDVRGKIKYSDDTGGKRELQGSNQLCEKLNIIIGRLEGENRELNKENHILVEQIQKIERNSRNKDKNVKVLSDEIALLNKKIADMTTDMENHMKTCTDTTTTNNNNNNNINNVTPPYDIQFTNDTDDKLPSEKLKDKKNDKLLKASRVDNIVIKKQQPKQNIQKPKPNSICSCLIAFTIDPGIAPDKKIIEKLKKDNKNMIIKMKKLASSFDAGQKIKEDEITRLKNEKENIIKEKEKIIKEKDDSIAQLTADKERLNKLLSQQKNENVDLCKSIPVETSGVKEMARSFKSFPKVFALYYKSCQVKERDVRISDEYIVFKNIYDNSQRRLWQANDPGYKNLGSQISSAQVNNPGFQYSNENRDRSKVRKKRKRIKMTERNNNYNSNSSNNNTQPKNSIQVVEITNQDEPVNQTKIQPISARKVQKLFNLAQSSEFEEEQMQMKIDPKIAKDLNLNSNEFKRQSTKIVEVSEGALFLFRLYDKRSILRFDIENQRFKVLEFADFGAFEENYNPQGSIYLNSVNGIFIVTGQNHDMFYYFNYMERSMIKLAKLYDNHTFGSLIYYPKENTIICLSGWHNRKVEKYVNDEIVASFFNNKIFQGQKRGKNAWSQMPEMQIERGECPYLIVNESNIYAFFGFNCPREIYIDTIEKLNLENPVTWENVIYKNEFHISTKIKSHSCVKINSNEVIFLGGFDGENESPIDSFFEYMIEESTIAPINRKYPDIVQNHFYNFQNDSAMVPYIDSKNRLHFTGFDEHDRVHVIEVKMMNYDIFSFD